MNYVTKKGRADEHRYQARYIINGIDRNQLCNHHATPGL